MIQQLKQQLSNNLKEEVILIETHISYILLAGQFAYKIKKPLKFSFIDASTLEKRKILCEREVRLNNRLSEGIYLAVVPISLVDNQLHIEDSKGRIIEYAVKMRRLDTARQMNVLMEEASVQPTQVKELAELIANFHAFTDTIDQLPVLKELKDTFNDVLKIKPVLEKLFGDHCAERLENACSLSDQLLDQLIGRIIERAKLGFIVDGHGDLHTGNIFLLEEPVVFDCIEFNDALRFIDVLNEVAFLCMDLNFFGRLDLETIFLDHYLKNYPCIFNDEDWVIFRYFKWYRANVRMKVNALPLLDAEPSASQKDRLEEYWQLFKEYQSLLSLTGDRPH